MNIDWISKVRSAEKKTIFRKTFVFLGKSVQVNCYVIV